MTQDECYAKFDNEVKQMNHLSDDNAEDNIIIYLNQGIKSVKNCKSAGNQ